MPIYSAGTQKLMLQQTMALLDSPVTTVLSIQADAAYQIFTQQRNHILLLLRDPAKSKEKRRPNADRVLRFDFDFVFDAIYFGPR